ncbi:hypothetical protein QMK19_31840 [Streptomyces sp. H10-C2]|uniref:hypothetical protein n=1 Tax=unclassified Streptomyces TaxID=2593676 RepID=UPI0024B87A01|nr:MULTISPECIES: hypothetical protein [unclassified Streptomyces]MDJ0345135.1 hypothetical protein [Streptomyces sp. PH10-H1]MDJ0374103.1 hypothetical protein [Streptomyces sp. H10-C2]
MTGHLPYAPAHDLRARMLNGDSFRVFGQDGTGGYAAFWLVRPGRSLVEQPVVFLGSEGDVGVVARDLAGYLWLLAEGFGPSKRSIHRKAPHDPPRSWRPSPNSSRPDSTSLRRQ